MTTRSRSLGGRGTIPRGRVLLALYATVFVDLLGFTLILPSLPFYVVRLGGGGVWLGVPMTVCLLALPVAPVPVFVAAVVLLSVGNGLTTATIASMLAMAGPAEQCGARMGQGQCAAAAARAVGPLNAGALFDCLAWLPYVIGAALSMGAAAAIVLGRPLATVRNRAWIDDVQS